LEPGSLVFDYGCGTGRFISALQAEKYRCVGFDVMEKAEKQLIAADLYRLPQDIADVNAMTMWDVFEHLDNHMFLRLLPVNSYAIMSLPVFDDLDDVMRSRHYRPGEHIWYFTDKGIRRFMLGNGYACMESHNEESHAGRDGIRTYVFKRYE